MNEERYYFAHLLRPYLEGVLHTENDGRSVDLGTLIARAHKQGIKTHFLKRLDNPRMIWALGKLKGLWPQTLLD
ncbi:MAG: hypothetical protein GY765_17425, partial [bacterium]|nr:hypothetical protein [bacterium]